MSLCFCDNRPALTVVPTVCTSCCLLLPLFSGWCLVGDMYATVCRYRVVRLGVWIGRGVCLISAPSFLNCQFIAVANVSHCAAPMFIFVYAHFGPPANQRNKVNRSRESGRSGAQGGTCNWSGDDGRIRKDSTKRSIGTYSGGRARKRAWRRNVLSKIWEDAFVMGPGSKHPPCHLALGREEEEADKHVEKDVGNRGRAAGTSCC